MRSKLAVGLLSRGTILSLALFGAASAFGTGCVVHERVVEEPTNEDVVVEREPPAEQVETQPAAPSNDHVWIKGHWRWNGHDWVWAPGHWEARRAGYEYVPGHWEHRTKGYVWIGGHWRRR